jgi:hypothetical protein
VRAGRDWTGTPHAGAISHGNAGAGSARQQIFTSSNDHISIIGNTLAERMQYDGWLETMLHARFPKHELVVRNLGFSGDEINTRPRSKNFGTPDEWLSGLALPIGGYEDNRFAGTNTKADVVFAFSAIPVAFTGRRASTPSKRTSGWITHPLAEATAAIGLIVVLLPHRSRDGHPDCLTAGEQPAPGLYTKAMAEVAHAGT